MAASDVASAVQLISYLLIQEASSLYGVEGQVQGLQEELEFMLQYLQDADGRKDDREVCALVRQVRKLAYDAEDVIDTYILKVRQRKGNWLTRFAYSMYNLPQVCKVRDQIQVLQMSLNRVSEKLNNHGVRKITNLERGLVYREDGYRRQRPQSYSHDDSEGAFVVGMEEDIRKLADIVMGEGRTQVGVISIVGMGGSGKTTLARKLYNHPYAKECFDCSAWVFISQEWSTQHVLSEILRKVGGLKRTAKLQSTFSVEELVDKLRNCFQNKSYLVVLDDVWSREALEEILPALPRGESLNKGSKIIITTRNREIIKFQLSHQEQLYIHEPQPLTEESSWELFSKIALSHRKNYDEESFKSVGRDMLRKCDGLPLAIVALAGILNTRGTIGEWHQVAEAVRSRIMEGRCGNMYGRVGELLALSYDDLPYDLKPCFLYLGVFPEDCQIPVGMLTRMWIAEGLISTQYHDMTLENVALQRIEELSHRFMIQVIRTNFEGAIKAIRVHDLLRDLSVQKAKEQSFLEIFTPYSNSDSSQVSTFAFQPRRAAIHSSTGLPAHISHLRSLTLMTQGSISRSYYSSKETLDVQVVSRNFKLLRLLTIWGVKIVGGILPVQVGCLIHLRYLAIRATNITVLPSSIGGLRNLLTLDYRDIALEYNIPKENIKIIIPNVFHGLVLLRHLFLPIEYPWSVQELKLSNLRNLRTLWGVRLDDDTSCLFKEVSTTLKKLKIVVSSDNELRAAFRCPSLITDVLHTLHCEMKGGVVLCNVKPLHLRQHLLKLTLVGVIQIKLSLVLPVNLITLELKDSVIKDDDFMAVLGTLAHLKQLIFSNAYTGTTLSCESGSFPLLEELKVESLPSLDDWTINKGAMPSLKKLEITRCWHLKNLPLGLNFVTTLEQFEFFDMPNQFCEQATDCGWAPQNRRLPHNFASIIKHADSSVDSSSIRTVYNQLTSGIFLDNKTMKYWVTKKYGNYLNCFMVYPSALLLGLSSTQYWAVGVQDIKQKYNKMENCPFVECREIRESSKNGTMVMVAKLKPSISLGYYEVVGSFRLANLSLNVCYEIHWVIMFKDPKDSDVIEGSKPGKKERQHLSSRRRNKGEVTPPAGHNEKREEGIIADEFEGVTMIYTKLCGREVHEEMILSRRPNKWRRVPGGVIETHLTMKEEVELSLCYYKGFNDLDFVIKGFIIQPK